MCVIYIYILHIYIYIYTYTYLIIYIYIYINSSAANFFHPKFKAHPHGWCYCMGQLESLLLNLSSCNGSRETKCLRCNAPTETQCRWWEWAESWRGGQILRCQKATHSKMEIINSSAANFFHPKFKAHPHGWCYCMGQLESLLLNLSSCNGSRETKCLRCNAPTETQCPSYPLLTIDHLSPAKEEKSLTKGFSP